jgi:hypothetical protein
VTRPATTSGQGGRGGIWWVLLGIALLWLASGLAYLPPTAKSSAASRTEFSAERARDAYAGLPGANEPHPSGSAAIARLRAGIVERLTALGYAPQTQSGFVCDDGGECAAVTNVLARLDPATPREDAPAILLAAHYDSVPAGPGASDDGVGVAAVLEIARILKASPAPPRPIILLIDDGEEAGLLGARLFVREHPWAKHIAAAVNLDARGSAGPALMFETGDANAGSITLYAQAVPRPITNSIFYLVYKLLPNDTDFTVFKNAGYQGFNLAFIGMVSRHHTPLDTWANVHSATLQDMGEHALASLHALTAATTLETTAGDAVYFDFFGRTLFQWPTQLSLPMALGMLGLLLAECATALRLRITRPGEIAWGLTAALLSIALGLALAAGLQLVLTHAGMVPPGLGSAWVAYPIPLTTAYSAIAFLAVISVSLLLARRARVWGLWLAVHILGSLIAVAFAWRAPALCFIYLIPALGAALGVLPCLRRPTVGGPASWQFTMAAAVPALLFFGLVLPMLWLLYDALGTLAWPMITLVLCCGAIALLPLLAAAGHRRRQLLAMIAVCIAVGGALIGASLPLYSADWPQAVNLEYWRDTDQGTYQWLARTGHPLPTALASAGHFGATPHSRFPGSLSRAFFAPAPAMPLPAPELTLIDSSSDGPLLHYHLKLSSARGAAAASVIFPQALGVDAVDLLTDPASTPLHVRLEKMHSGARALRLLTLPGDGVEFSFETKRAPELQVFDMSYGLPVEGRFLQAARPATALPFQEGDVTIVYRRLTLPAPAAEASQQLLRGEGR